MILTRFTGAPAALRAWCVPATAAATPAFDLPGVPDRARDGAGARFQAIDGVPASAPRTDAVHPASGPVTVPPRQRGCDFVFPQP